MAAAVLPTRHAIHRAVGAPALGLALVSALAGCLTAPPKDGLGATSAVVVRCEGIEEWTDQRSYETGDVVRHDGGVFQCTQPHTPAFDWEPDVVAALWSPATCDDGGDDGGDDAGGDDGPPDPGPPVDDPPVEFPPLLDARFFHLDLARTGADPSNGQLAVVGQIADGAFRSFRPLIDAAIVTVGTDGGGRPQEIRRAVVDGISLESHNTVADGVQDVIVFVDRIKRMQFTRNLRTGAFEGVLVGNAEDRGAPMVAVVTPVGGERSHLLIADIGNNQRNDLRGTVVADADLAPVRGAEVTTFQGGMAGQPESKGVIDRFDFRGIITGF
jgi:hypothetical protein